jgi:hypothetical protein
MGNTRFNERRDHGGPGGIRTPDLLNAIEARSQLRHRPTNQIKANSPGIIAPDSHVQQLVGEGPIAANNPPKDIGGASP